MQVEVGEFLRLLFKTLLNENKIIPLQKNPEIIFLKAINL
jgi:hypothetical protein